MRSSSISHQKKLSGTYPLESQKYGRKGSLSSLSPCMCILDNIYAYQPYESFAYSHIRVRKTNVIHNWVVLKGKNWFTTTVFYNSFSQSSLASPLFGPPFAFHQVVYKRSSDQFNGIQTELDHHYFHLWPKAIAKWQT